MGEDVIYEQWLTQGDLFKQKYYGLQWIGMTAWAVVFAVCIIGFKQDLLISASLGFLPFFLCFVASFAYYDKWKDCELKYRRHVPFIDVKQMNVLISSLEFQPGQIICHYFRHDGLLSSISLPSQDVHILPSQDEHDSLQLRMDVNNFTHQEKWVFIHINLTPSSQQKLLALTH